MHPLQFKAITEQLFHQMPLTWQGLKTLSYFRSLCNEKKAKFQKEYKIQKTKQTPFDSHHLRSTGKYLTLLLQITIALVNFRKIK